MKEQKEQEKLIVKIYVWLPAGITIPCQCSSRGCKCCTGNYGHAAMSIPYIDEVKSLPLLKEYAHEIKEYPLYLSLVEKKLKNTAQNSKQYVSGGFNNTEEDSERYGEKYHAYVISLPCTKKEIITLWRGFLEKLQIKEKPLLDVGNYNVPDILIGGKEGHNIIFPSVQIVLPKKTTVLPLSSICSKRRELKD